MTRSQAYEEGFSEGYRWAESDARDAVGYDHEPEMRERLLFAGRPETRARILGNLRGYREACHRIEVGSLTREMFDLGPVNR